METERIELSARERERLKVWHEVEQGHLKQIEAAHRLRREGDRGMVHRLRGCRSNRKIPEALKQRALRELHQARYAGFGPTLASEHLTTQGMPVSRETLRGWMSEAGLWRARARRRKAVHVWRPRRAAFGDLLLMDSSYRWLEDRGPAGHLIALIDDATSRAWGRLGEHDSTEENLRTLRGWLERHGRPLALYTDKSGLFVTSRPVQWPEQLRGEPARTQIGRALAELDIRMDRGAFSASQGTHRTAVWHAASVDTSRAFSVFGLSFGLPRELLFFGCILSSAIRTNSGERYQCAAVSSIGDERRTVLTSRTQLAGAGCKPPQAAWAKSPGRERCGKGATRHQVRTKEGEHK